MSGARSVMWGLRVRRASLASEQEGFGLEGRRRPEERPLTPEERPQGLCLLDVPHWFFGLCTFPRVSLLPAPSRGNYKSLHPGPALEAGALVSLGIALVTMAHGTAEAGVWVPGTSQG